MQAMGIDTSTLFRNGKGSLRALRPVLDITLQEKCEHIEEEYRGEQEKIEVEKVSYKKKNWKSQDDFFQGRGKREDLITVHSQTNKQKKVVRERRGTWLD